MRFIDISSNNHPNQAPIDWGLVTASGIQGVAIKLTEADYENPYAAADYASAEQAGIACFCLYDFARQDLESGARDATLYLQGVEQMGGRRAGTRDALDIEEHGGPGPQVDPHADLQAYALDWASVVWPRTTRRYVDWKPLLYSRRSYLLDHNLTGSADLDATFDLWLVWDGDPTPPPGWSRVAFWQHLENTALVPGIQGPVDHDTFPSIAYDWLWHSWGY